MARVHDDSSNMDNGLEWITPSLPNGNSPIIWKVIKKSADRNFNRKVLDAYISFAMSY